MKKTWITILLLFIASPLQAENWPAWRGADGRGVSQEKNLPLSWSATENVLWKVPLAEPCNGTPIIWGDRVFLTQGLDKGKRRAVIALDRASGKKLWQQERPCEVEETTHPQNPPCSSSPITDGKAVYAQLGSAGVVAYDLDGKQLWHRDLGPVLHRWGNGPSPVLYGDLLIVFHGPGIPANMMALDKTSGETVWTSKETAINSPIFGSWSTPLLLKGKRDELIMPLPGDRIQGAGLFKSYDPATGKLLWKCDGLGNEVYAMPIPSPAGDLVVGISGHNGPAMAVRTGGNGDVSATHQLWRTVEKNPQRVSSGVIDGKHLYIANANGTLDCLLAGSGELVWKGRLGGNLWGSMLLADGRIYLSNFDGDTFVVKAGEKFELLATNQLAEPLYAAPAVSGGAIFLRTYKHLYCIGRGEGN
ncbi:MAG: PQQ-binding-like beta-propeller repeat protein [Pirellulaceae bacterium]|nr:PQQ-binding-like beta-propeller repeat protein [Pirellulaceae bacterium]